MTNDLSSCEAGDRNCYQRLSVSELTDRIRTIKSKYGGKLLILGHLYERSEILAVSDAQGDSFQLSALAAADDQCETIVFCGVHFMAETADILANTANKIFKRNGRRVQVIIPDPLAGCAMADMAELAAVEQCWSELTARVDIEQVIPVTYVNSSAELKGFCGRHGGIACTSTNARSVLDWAFRQGQRVLFFPDQHLGRNTAIAMGIPESEQVLWNPDLPSGGLQEKDFERSKVFLWNGFCPVHQLFSTDDIARVRREEPNAQIVIHPECPKELVQRADCAGSTSYIRNAVKTGSEDATWYIGTEYNLIEHVANEFPEKSIRNLSTVPQYCPTMALIDLPKLCRVLEDWDAGRSVPYVQVPETTARDALVCLERMLACKN